MAKIFESVQADFILIDPEFSLGPPSSSPARTPEKQSSVVRLMRDVRASFAMFTSIRLPSSRDTPNTWAHSYPRLHSTASVLLVERSIRFGAASFEDF